MFESDTSILLSFAVAFNTSLELTAYACPAWTAPVTSDLSLMIRVLLFAVTSLFKISLVPSLKYLMLSALPATVPYSVIVEFETVNLLLFAVIPEDEVTTSDRVESLSSSSLPLTSELKSSKASEKKFYAQEIKKLRAEQDKLKEKLNNLLIFQFKIFKIIYFWIDIINHLYLYLLSL